MFALQGELNERVTAMADEINSLAEQIRQLNMQIASTEGGDTSGSEAAGLRVQRQNAVDRLSELVGIHVDEQPSGGVDASPSAASFWCSKGSAARWRSARSTDNGLAIGRHQVCRHRLAAATRRPASCRACTPPATRSSAAFSTELDELAGTLAFEFNKVYSQGQGLVGFQQLTSVETVNDAERGARRGRPGVHARERHVRRRHPQQDEPAPHAQRTRFSST